jgi:uncharacterized membrane protein YgdD (TMEM256/DUF423 family)
VFIYNVLQIRRNVKEVFGGGLKVIFYLNYLRSMNAKRWYQGGYVLLALGVVCGAFGAHSLKSILSITSLQVWQTAVLYHFIHALGLLLLVQYVHQSTWTQWAVRLLFAGILCFSGSLYLLACKDHLPLPVAWLGPITPIGGVLWIAGWICAAVGSKKYHTQ